MNMLKKKCPKCGLEKEGSFFGTRLINGKRYLKSWCRLCKNEAQKPADAMRDRREYNKARGQRLGVRRKNGENRDLWALIDARHEDKKRCRENDLDRDFVKNLLKNGCVYCGAIGAESRVGLDRINNSIGHLKSNVVPACMNCNLTRGTMPYEAWIKIAPAVREVRRLGLLNGWSRRG
jgi:hypothetical protein